MFIIATKNNQGDLLAQVKHELNGNDFDEVKVTMPGEYRLRQKHGAMEKRAWHTR